MCDKNLKDLKDIVKMIVEEKEELYFCQIQNNKYLCNIDKYKFLIEDGIGSYQRITELNNNIVFEYPFNLE